MGSDNRTPEGSRLIVANLDCELDFPSSYPPLAASYRRPDLSAKAQAKLSRLAPLLRFLGKEEDRVVVDLESQTAALGRKDRPSILAWAETEEVRRWRGGSSTTYSTVTRSLKDRNLPDLLWHLPTTDPTTAARVNHRSFFLETAVALDLALPGSKLIESLCELGSLAAPGDQPNTANGWVLKAPFSAAGRGHVWLPFDGSKEQNQRARKRAERLLAVFGSLLLEPWMKRTEDFGCCAVVTRQDLEILSLHEQRIDRHGGFHGLTMDPEPLSCSSLEPQERDALIETTERVGRRLRRAGYVGPFGVDAWRYETADGRQHFHPLGEINARLTFGFVGRCVLNSFQSKGLVPAGARAVLHLSDPPSETTEAAFPVTSGAWLEIEHPRPGVAKELEEASKTNNCSLHE